MWFKGFGGAVKYKKKSNYYQQTTHFFPIAKVYCVCDFGILNMLKPHCGIFQVILATSQEKLNI